jgi:hypothetical protein
MRFAGKFRQCVVISGFCTLAAAGGCSHIAGVVVDERQRPLPTAVFSIGRPDGLATYGTHKVDSRGRFDFQLSAVDETNLYVYDGAGDPMSTLQHVDRNQISNHMKIELKRAVPGEGREDLMTVPPGLMQ